MFLLFIFIYLFIYIFLLFIYFYLFIIYLLFLFFYCLFYVLVNEVANCILQICYTATVQIEVSFRHFCMKLFMISRILECAEKWHHHIRLPVAHPPAGDARGDAPFSSRQRTA